MPFNKKLERLLNVAIVIAIVSLSGLLAKRLLADYANKKTALVGTKLALKGVAWGESRQTLLLAFSNECGYCAESAPYYKRLAEESGRHGTRFVAVAKTPVEDSRSYLAAHGIAANLIVQARLSTIGINNVPTLLLVDERGIVRNVWVGKLSGAAENEVMGRVGAAGGLNEAESARSELSGDDQTNRVEVEDLKAMIERRQEVVVVDIRDREAYAKEHIPTAINIPADEIYSRALDELAQSKLIVISHLRCNSDEVSRAIRDDLSAQGFPKVASLTKGIDGWKEAGFRLEAAQ